MYTEDDVKQALLSGYIIGTVLDDIIVDEITMWENYQKFVLKKRTLNFKKQVWI